MDLSRHYTRYGAQERVPPRNSELHNLGKFRPFREPPFWLGPSSNLGRIPGKLGQLRHISNFTVSLNHLSGPVPHFVHTKLTEDGYAFNKGLSGGALI
ncbi:hypothetical protein Patl1_26967 [Pistacia atlantica]|uniref:Uncharacterized protein n=1 Tax=Pistacia atlantica TaxID=434234 RepID=A0ACC1AZF9_9ROSI|nr:hypothetical protein Patl1_26967 [Pistacia atlantica]